MPRNPKTNYSRRIILIAIAGIFVLIAIALLLSLAIGSLKGIGFANSIAIIPIKGEIASEQDALSASISSEQIVELLDEAENDFSIGAVLLDIDSPGGTIVATKQIAYKVKAMKKPVVAWISDLGASGAYYVASAADLVLADSDSITGSIGVITIAPNLTGLAEKFGIKMKILKEGKFKSMGNPFEEMSAEEQVLFQQILHDAFNNFKHDVMKFRKGKLQQAGFEEIADGRILSGKQARDLGLIDKIATRELAIKEAAKLAGISAKPQIRKYEKASLGLFDLVAKSAYYFGLGFKRASLDYESGIKIK